MNIPNPPQGYDPLRYHRESPVDRVRSVKIGDDATFVVELDYLDDGSYGTVPDFEHQPTRAAIGMSRANAEKLLELLNATLAVDVAKAVSNQDEAA
jgi:hypothetical protein